MVILSLSNLRVPVCLEKETSSMVVRDAAGSLQHLLQKFTFHSCRDFSQIFTHLMLYRFLHSRYLEDCNRQERAEGRSEEQACSAGHAKPSSDPDCTGSGQAPHIAIDIVCIQSASD